MPKKHNPDSTASQRAIRLFALLLFTGRKHFLSDLADEFICTKPTIMRSIQAIQLSYAAEIEEGFEGGRKWYQLKNLPRTPHVGLTSTEVEKLALCRDLIAHLLPEGIEQIISEGIAKISTLMSQPENREAVTARKASNVPWGRIDYTPFQKILDIMLQSIATRTVCNITYQEIEYRIEREGLQHYPFVPVRLVTEDDTLFMEGWLVTNSSTPEIKHAVTLAIHRMHSCTLTNKKLVGNSSFPDHQGAFGLVGYEAFPARVQFSEEFAPFIRERVWSEEQEIIDLDDGEIELRFMAADEGQLVSWVMGFGLSAELIEPVHLREWILEEVLEMKDYYASGGDSTDQE